MTGQVFNVEVENARDFGKSFIEKHGDRLWYLYNRWLDEREYEDFKDYEAELKKLAETAPEIEFKKGVKRPFGFVTHYKPLNRRLDFCVSTKGIGYTFPKVAR